MERHTKKPVIVIVGPTGSGKTALALDLADKYNGEIICADSRTVYRYLTIGTAKPTSEERARVKHHLIDIVNPNENFTVVDFQKQAKALIYDIHRRDKIPFIAGGTGLYIDSLLFDYKFTTKRASQSRAMLEAMKVEELINYSIKNNIELPENTLNKRYLIRSIEQGGINRQRKSKVPDNFLVVGIATNKEELLSRLQARAQNIFSKNVVQETLSAVNKFGWNNESMTGNIYPVLRSVLNKEITIEEAKEKFITLDWRLAKRQMTWFKRNPDIVWLPYDEARQFIAKIIDRQQR